MGRLVEEAFTKIDTYLLIGMVFACLNLSSRPPDSVKEIVILNTLFSRRVNAGHFEGNPLSLSP